MIVKDLWINNSAVNYPAVNHAMVLWFLTGRICIGSWEMNSTGEGYFEKSI